LHSQHDFGKQVKFDLIRTTETRLFSSSWNICRTNILQISGQLELLRSFLTTSRAPLVHCRLAQHLESSLQQLGLPLNSVLQRANPQAPPLLTHGIPTPRRMPPQPNSTTSSPLSHLPLPLDIPVTLSPPLRRRPLPRRPISPKPRMFRPLPRQLLQVPRPTPTA
jgi:hypothetical protein